ncbi:MULTISPECIES: YitT family protein [unclassified Carboxydocella]|uniref:YitT family protein n=1 Tax=unclassified Carboxydocella TaxID=2685367 RepID=UPI0009AD0C0D|nr:MULTISPECIES: YitT family protein [unclassified Carboxydocella]GAW29307.1 membrane protein [Carboxydocella sp. ULO1]GAW30742.1 membrane protein [Carboxydocella sp. JDF658]
MTTWRKSKFIWQSLGTLLGSLITAAGIVWFLAPNQIAAGGVSGIAIILNKLFGFPVGRSMLAMEIPLFIASTLALGWGFAARTFLGALTLPIFVDLLTPYLQPATSNLLLASLYGGVVTGAGIGLVFRSKGSTGGTDELAALLHKFVGLPLGQILLFIDGLVILGATLVFGVEKALYALITVFVAARVIDLVQEGIISAKAAFIISDHSEEIACNIMTRLDRGVTSLAGKGAYTGISRHVLLSVVSQSEVSRLKEVVYETDPQAFVIVTDVHEVLGEGFKKFN